MNILHVVCTYPSEQKPFEQPFTKAQVDSLISIGVESHVYNIKGYESTFNYIKAIINIGNYVKKHKIDLIHAHYSYAGLSSFLSNSKKPILLSLMGSDLLGVPDLKGNLTIRGKFDKTLAQFISKRVNLIIVKSERMKKSVITNVPVHVVPNGVNTEHFIPKDMKECRKKIGLRENAFYILFLGNPKLNRKNFSLAKEAVDFLNDKYKSVDAKLLTPYGISSAEVVDYMNASNLLLQTSYWEGSPNVIKESMSCNLPIVTTDVGDVEEILSNTKNCFIVPYDKEKIADKIYILSNKYERSDGRTKMGKLQLNLVAKRIENIYHSMLN